MIGVSIRYTGKEKILIEKITFLNKFTKLFLLKINILTNLTNK